MKWKFVLWGALAALAVGAGLLIWALDFGSWQPLDMEKLRALPQSSTLYDQDGAETALLPGAEDRRAVALNDVPLYVRRAFLAAEDARFYEHCGVDPYRIAGALVYNIRHGGYAQGASTITQQLVKLTHLHSGKTLSRKAQEAYLALQLERRASKDEILSYYLNVVYFGNGAYGIEAAARKYFGVPVGDLTLAQGALLAAVIKSPTRYAPHTHPERARERRDWVLEEMAEYGFVAPAEAAAAKAEPIALKEAETARYGWYVDAALREAEELLGLSGEAFLSGGYRVYTALDRGAQAAAEKLFMEDARFYRDAQAALVALNVQNGEIFAVVGGREYSARRALNRATQSRRQPGSAFKPVSVYAAAVDQYGYLPSSFVDDTRRDFGNGYSPGNAGGNYYGPVTLREALSKSLNAATVDLMTKISVPSALRYARRLGLSLDENDENLSAALGSLTYGLTPASLGAAYAALANGGRAVEAHTVRKIVDARGKTVYEHRQTGASALKPQSAYLLTDMLVSAAQSGTARALGELPFPAAGKTGTVALAGGGNRDAWTVAYTPKVATAVWMGYDEADAERHLPDSVSGSSLPARLAAGFLSAIEARADGGKFAKPSGLTEVLLDGRALSTLHVPLLAGEYTPPSALRRELFPTGKAPTRFSDIWRAPEPVEAVALAADAEAGTVTISFVARQAEALYRVYREDESGETLIGELRGEAGETLSCTDAPAGEAVYGVLPLQAELLSEGITLPGERTRSEPYAPGILPGLFHFLRLDS